MSHNEQEPMNVSLLLQLAAQSPLPCCVVHTSDLGPCHPRPSIRCIHAYESMSKPPSPCPLIQHATATNNSDNQPFWNFGTMTVSMPKPQSRTTNAILNM